MTRSIPTVLAALAAFACLLSPPAAPADVFSLGSGLTSLELVSVGDAGKGNVDYSYMIGKYEVTAAQYTVFLNAVAATDSYGLYDTRMSSETRGCQIVRLGSSGSYSYQVAIEYANRPVNFVDWGDAARFVNWLHNGQPTGAQGVGTTEDGAYTMNTQTGFALTVDRNPGARYWIPSDAEWKKAAYYDPTRHDGGGGFWEYPTQSSSTPGRALDDPGNNHVNHDAWASMGTPPPIDDPYYTTEVGHFQRSSYYGTFDQAGNVAEWTEGKSDSPIGRTLWGGSFVSAASELKSPGSTAFSPDGSCMGFRIAGVPEPGGMAALIGMAAVGFVWFWRRR